MKKKIKINNLEDVQTVISAATELFDAIHVQDQLGARANAKSILGVIALDCSQPLTVESENPEAVLAICKSIKQ